MGEMAVVECQGRIVRSEAAFRLRDAVTSHGDARAIVLDLSEVYALGGAGLEILVFLRRWASEHDIRLKLFNPSRFVLHRIEQAGSTCEFEIANLHEMMALRARSETLHGLAS
jgi:anti-anti-sigma regulatory factor